MASHLVEHINPSFGSVPFVVCGDGYMLVLSVQDGDISSGLTLINSQCDFITFQHLHRRWEPPLILVDGPHRACIFVEKQVGKRGGGVEIISGDIPSLTNKGSTSFNTTLTNLACWACTA